MLIGGPKRGRPPLLDRTVLNSMIRIDQLKALRAIRGKKKFPITQQLERALAIWIKLHTDKNGEVQ